MILGVAAAATILVSLPDRAEAGLFCHHRGCNAGCYSGCYTPFPPCGWPYWAEPGCGMPRGHHCCHLFGWLFHCHHKHFGCCMNGGCPIVYDGAYCGDSGCFDGGCDSGGCADGNCVGGGCANGDCGAGSYDSDYDGQVEGESVIGGEGMPTEGNPKVIYDGPAAGAPQIQQQEPVVAPPAGDSAAARQSPHRLASYRRQVSASFEKGLTLYRERRLTEAANEFQAAVNADPNNALYLYFNALAMYDQHGAEAAGDALQQAIQAERRQPVANWGQAMERVQGQGRLWIEKARRDAGLVR